MSTHVELERATADRDALAATLREVLSRFEVVPHDGCERTLIRHHPILSTDLARWRAVLDKHGGWVPVAHDSINDYCREALQREANRR